MSTTARSSSDPLLLAWSALLLLSAATWALGHNDGDSWAVLLIVVACAKARIVAIHFMEVGRAPMPLRLVVEGWTLLVAAGLCAIYLLG